MGSPVFFVVAEKVMQNIEEQALATHSETLPLWLRLVDNTITAVHENKIDEFHEHLKGENTNIQFTTQSITVVPDGIIHVVMKRQVSFAGHRSLFYQNRKYPKHF